MGTTRKLPHLEPWVIVVLGAVAFVAATIDAIAGGGGLLNVPALLLAGLPPQVALGTNKLAGIAGTATSTATFAAARTIKWQLGLCATIAALAGSAVGTHVVLQLDARVVRIIVIALLVAVMLVVTINPKFGQAGVSEPKPNLLWRAAALSLILGFYDGFFGPGAGLFLAFAFVAGLGLELLSATALAKAANFASNLGSVIVFAIGGAIDYQAGVVMAICAIGGGFIGSRLAIVRGAPFIRTIFLAVAWLLAASLVWQALRR